MVVDHKFLYVPLVYCDRSITRQEFLQTMMMYSKLIEDIAHEPYLFDCIWFDYERSRQEDSNQIVHRKINSFIVLFFGDIRAKV